MAFKSRARESYMEWLESKGKIPKEDDYNPEHFSDGGVIDEDMSEGWENFLEPHDSAGEPHTRDKREDEEPEEYMAYGGRVKKMSSGGFAKALRMRRS